MNWEAGWLSDGRISKSKSCRSQNCGVEAKASINVTDTVQVRGAVAYAKGTPNQKW